MMKSMYRLILSTWVLLFTFKLVFASNGSYLIEVPAPMNLASHNFSPILISGDGNVIFGEDLDRLMLSRWTKDSGLTPVIGLPSNYDFSPLTINYKGNVIGGFFTAGYPLLKDYGLFLWSLKDGTKLINLHFFLNGSKMSSFEVSEDGSRILFICTNSVLVHAGCSTDKTLNNAPFVQKFWSSATGFQSFSKVIDVAYDYIRSANNGRIYMVGAIGTSRFGWLDSRGKFTLFDKFPNDFDPETDRTVISPNGAFVAIFDTKLKRTFVWNQSGQSMPLFRLPLGCKDFYVTDIDDRNAFFGFAYCSMLRGSTSIGLRATFGQVETIHNWLEDEGLPNHLGLDTAVTLVSENGRTVYGQTNLSQAVGAEGASSNEVYDRNDCIKSVCSFLARIP